MNTLLTVKEAAEYLGLSRATIFKLLRNGQLARIKLGPQTTRLDLTDINRYIEAHKNGPHGAATPYARA